MNHPIAPTMKFILTTLSTLLLTGCFLLTDAATRVAYDLEAAVAVMQAKGLDEYAFTHVPASFPDGVDGPWELTIQKSKAGEPRGALGIGRYGTTYHTNFVDVPRTLTIRKQAGEGCTIVLRRAGERIEVVALR